MIMGFPRIEDRLQQTRNLLGKVTCYYDRVIQYTTEALIYHRDTIIPEEFTNIL